MQANNNFDIFPLYDSLEKQAYKKWYNTTGSKWPILTTPFNLPAFQWKIPVYYLTYDNTEGTGTLASTLSTAFMEIYNLEGNLVDTPAMTFTTDGTVFRLDTHFSISNGVYVLSHIPISKFMDLSAGTYYCKVTCVWHDNQNNIYETKYMYSEVFCVCEDYEKLVRIEYFNTADLELSKDNGYFNYTHQYKNVLYVDSEIGMPEYPFDETAVSRDGYQFMEKQISYKKYKFTFACPEFILDAMRVIGMHNGIRVIANGIKYNVDTFLVTPKWQDGGFISLTSVEFTTDTVVKTLGDVVTPSMTTSVEVIEVAATGGTYSFSIASNIDWDVETNKDWVNIVNDIGYNDGSLVFNCDVNIASGERKGVIIIKGGGLIRIVIINQLSDMPYIYMGFHNNKGIYVLSGTEIQPTNRTSLTINEIINFNNSLYFLTDTGIYYLNLSTGTIEPTTKTNGQFYCGKVFNNRLYVAGHAIGICYITTDNTIHYTSNTTGSFVSMASHGNYLYAGSSDDTGIYYLSTESNTVNPIINNVEESFYSMIEFGESIYVSGYAVRELYSWTIGAPYMLRTVNLSKLPINSSFLTDGINLYLYTTTYLYYLANGIFNKLLRFPDYFPNGICSSCYFNGRFYFGSDDFYNNAGYLVTVKDNTLENIITLPRAYFYDMIVYSGQLYISATNDNGWNIYKVTNEATLELTLVATKQVSGLKSVLGAL